MREVILFESMKDLYFPTPEARKEIKTAKLVAYKTKITGEVRIIKNKIDNKTRMSYEDFTEKYFEELL